MSGVGWVDTVNEPVTSRSLLFGVVEPLGENEHSIELIGELLNHLLTLFQIVEPLNSNDIAQSGERFNKYNFRFGQNLSGPGNQLAVYSQEAWRFYSVAAIEFMPYIVNPDKDGKQIRFKVKRVYFPSGI